MTGESLALRLGLDPDVGPRELLRAKAALFEDQCPLWSPGGVERRNLEAGKVVLSYELSRPSLVNHGPVGTPPEPISLTEAFRMWAPGLIRFARTIAVERGLPESYAGAEDVVQQTFEAASKIEWDSIVWQRAWLYTVVLRKVVAEADRYSRARDGFAEGRGIRTWSSLVPESSVETHLDVRLVHDLLVQMPTQRKRIAYLNLFEGYRPVEIAEILEISASNVRNVLSRVREDLSEHVSYPTNRHAVGDERRSLHVDGKRIYASDRRRVRRIALVAAVIVVVLVLGGLLGLVL
ncbi:Uncharacterised protein [Amycolatopsis camponoti]|uniref:RNA polymerase sigma factor 70 region 4 type 2 domain-containing protein n=1 Tax=Amycolatopsis camponoti TaxID=2606593 RepID=A0A6I8M1K5_9PSEU|nr:sigma-70 family RNA polymerase sigma factor [Amycolatopsis camponoti]VVJ22760.1 Uncharacterised protein [Amycolatopsis camponoti]